MRRRASKLQWGRGSAAAELAAAAVRRCSGRSASMGPRQRCRGIILTLAPRCTPRRCFNGAAAALPRNWRYQIGIALRARASMGPRQRCRGIDPGGLRRDAVLVASMGPRQRCRGIARDVAELPWAAAWLQWGRGSAAAEFMLAGDFGYVMMQCFNGAAAALPRNCASKRCQAADAGCFNGAAAALPRNCIRSPIEVP